MDDDPGPGAGDAGLGPDEAGGRPGHFLRAVTGLFAGAVHAKELCAVVTSDALHEAFLAISRDWARDVPGLSYAGLAARYADPVLASTFAGVFVRDSCAATTKKGRRCSRPASVRGLCYAHRAADDADRAKRRRVAAYVATLPPADDSRRTLPGKDASDAPEEKDAETDFLADHVRATLRYADLLKHGSSPQRRSNPLIGALHEEVYPTVRQLTHFACRRGRRHVHAGSKWGVRRWCRPGWCDRVSQRWLGQRSRGSRRKDWGRCLLRSG